MHDLTHYLREAVKTDISQMGEYGFNETALTEELTGIHSLDDLQAFQRDLWQRPSPAGFPYDEPDDWQSISATFPKTDAAPLPASDMLRNRLYGGWLGRGAGCVLGKPVEGFSAAAIKTMLQLSGSWPLKDYMPEPVLTEKSFTAAGLDPGLLKWFGTMKNCTRGNIAAVVPDDDIHYAVTNQLVTEEHGAGFTTEDIIEKILRLTPLSFLFASGKNMVKTYLNGLRPPATALFGNPCRQSLGALIRCDAWGWASPGNPRQAVEFAYRDAVGSQTRNGIYGGMFFAALIADVLDHGDIARAIDTATGFVPPRSRFAEMVHAVRTWCGAEDDWEKINAKIMQRYDKENPRAESLVMNHILPNAAICLMSLLKGGGDFSRSITLAVMAGMDTDCNGATVGSIAGCAVGAAAIPGSWSEPLHDTIFTELRDHHHLKISDLSERMTRTAEKLSCVHAI